VPSILADIYWAGLLLSMMITICLSSQQRFYTNIYGE